MNLMSNAQMEKMRRVECAKYDLNYFTSEYWKEDLRGISGNKNLSYDDPDHSIRFRIIASAIEKYTKYSSILDAGCGPGLLLSALGEQFSERIGIDVSPVAINLARSSLESCGDGSLKTKFIESSITNLALENDSTDLIVCLDVFEHLPVFDISDAVSELFRVCRNELIISVNTDNPYHYHPTILSRDTWRGIFASQDGFERNIELEDQLYASISSARTEYDFYCYRNVRGSLS